MSLSSYALHTETLDCLLIGKVLIIGDAGAGKTSLFNKFIGKGFCEHTPTTIGIDFHSTEVRIDHNRLSTQLSSKLEKIVNKQNHETHIKTQTKAIYDSSSTLTPKSKDLIPLVKNKIIKTLKSNPNTGIKLQLWDAAGQEKFRSIVKAYYRNSSIILLVFDLYNRESFEHLISWIDQVLNSNKWDNEFPLFFLIGNKNDLDSSHLVKPITQEEIDNFCDHYKVTSYYSISAKLDEARIKTILIDIAHELYFHAEFVHELRSFIHNPSLASGNSSTIAKSNQISEEQLVRQAACCLLL